MTNTRVSSSVTSTSLTLNEGDTMSVYGTAVSTTVNSGGTEYVCSGGTTSFTVVNSGGAEDVYTNGMARGTRVTSQGIAFVSPSGTASDTAVSSGGAEFVDGTSISTTVSSGGYLVVLPGGVSIDTAVQSGAEVVSTGVATATTSGTTGSSGFAVYGNVASDLTFDTGEVGYVLPSGTTISTTVTSEGTEFVYFGGSASDTAVCSGGAEFVGGISISTTVSSGGYDDAFANGTAIDTVLNSGGSEYVAGGTAIGTTVNDGGYQDVSHGGTASGTTVNSGGSEYVGVDVYYDGVYFSGTTISTTVNSGGVEALILGTASDTMLNVGGAIDVTLLPYAGGGSASVSTSGLLTVSVGGVSYPLQLAGNYAGEHFQLAPDSGGGSPFSLEGTLVTAEAGAPCYRSGTRILTARGEVPVEELLSGDLVPTVLGQTLVPIIWVGHRTVDCARHAKPKQVWPVRVAAGAFGPGQPGKELFLSPDHAVYVNAVLIPIRHLINGGSITQVQVDQVAYYHIELAEHDVVLAEGLPAESFLDLRDGSNYANRPGPERLYPDYSARMWEAFGCARLVVTGLELLAARSLVAGFAAAVVDSAAVERDAA